MSIWDRWRRRQRGRGPIDIALSLRSGALATTSGVDVTPERALSFAAVWACVRNLAEDVSTLPLVTYRRLPSGGRERALDHPLYPLLHDIANPEMPSQRLREALQMCLGLWGNAYAEIEFDGAGRPVALWPMLPRRVRVERSPDGELVYIVDTAGVGEPGPVVLPAWRVLHVMGPSLNGLVGLSPVGLAREAIALGIAAEEFGARFFSNDATPGFFISVPGELSREAFERLRQQWDEYHRGLTRAHRVALLEEGARVERIGIPPEDAEFLAARKFQAEEIARWYRMPPHKIGLLDRATHSNIEHQAIEYVVDTLRPWLVRWEQAIALRLISPRDRGTIYVEHLVDGLLRGDQQSRYQAYAIGRLNGWLSANEIRERENMPPIPGGDAYWMPLNVAPVMAPARALTRAQGSDRERILARRRRLREAWREPVRDAAHRIVRREVADARRAARRLLARGLREWEAWVDQQYAGWDDLVAETMRPSLGAYMRAVAAELAEELDAAPPPDAVLELLIGGYLAQLGRAWAGASRGQLLSVASDALRAGGDPLEALAARLDEWLETRAVKTADREVVEAGEASAVETYRLSGTTALVWVANANACPLCQEMDGRVVGAGEAYLAPSGVVEADEDRLVAGGRVAHPPLHRGCSCAVAPA